MGATGGGQHPGTGDAKSPATATGNLTGAAANSLHATEREVAAGANPYRVMMLICRNRLHQMMGRMRVCT